MKFLIQLLLIFFLLPQIDAQTGAFKTYIDYKNKEVTDLGNYMASSRNAEGIYLQFTEKKAILKDYWGFVIEGELYRVDPKRGNLAKVISTGDFVYYENPWQELRSTNLSDELDQKPEGPLAYVSKDLNARMAPIRLVYADRFNDAFMQFTR